MKESVPLPKSSPESDRERHETAIGAVIDRLRGEGYFRDGETTELVFPEPGVTEKWVARCDTKAFMNAAPDPERKKRFPSADPLYDALVAAGYKVDVWPDWEKSDDDFFHVEYRLSK